MTDVELLAQHRNGSQSAFADLVRRHLDWVYGVARRRVRDAHLADDVAQAVFILLHRKAPEFAADGAMISWLYRTACYASETAARSERRRTNRETQYATEKPETIDARIVESAEWNELAPVLDRLIGKLPASDREVILLRYYRDLTPVQMAQEIGITPEAARKRVDRAVERLRGLAGERGLAVSSIALAAGLGQFIRMPAPPGLLATSTVAATAPAGSAIAASSAAIVKGTVIMTAGTKITIASVVAVCTLLSARRRRLFDLRPFSLKSTMVVPAPTAARPDGAGSRTNSGSGASDRRAAADAGSEGAFRCERPDSQARALLGDSLARGCAGGPGSRKLVRAGFGEWIDGTADHPEPARQQ